jgi:hypothetical protein
LEIPFFFKINHNNNNNSSSSSSSSSSNNNDNKNNNIIPFQVSGVKNRLQIPGIRTKHGQLYYLTCPPETVEQNLTDIKIK